MAKIIGTEASINLADSRSLPSRSRAAATAAKTMLSPSIFRRLTATNPHRHISSLPPPKTISATTTTTAPLTHESVLYVLKKLEHDPLKALSFFDHASTTLRFKPTPPIYALLLRSLARREHAPSFWDVAGRMDRDGCSLDGGAYFTILVAFKRERMFSDAARFTDFFSRKNNGNTDAVRALVDQIVIGEKKLSLSDCDPRVCGRVLHELRHWPTKALSFFRSSTNCGGVRIGGSLYNSMLRILGQGKSKSSIGDFWELAEEMEREGFRIDIDTYIKVLRQFQKMKLLHDAVRLYEHMMDGPYKPAVQDCGLLLRQISLGDPPDLELVYRVVDKYKAAGHSMSKVVYDGMIRSLARSGEFDEAKRLIREMRNEGFDPDNITHSQMVFGLCKAERFDEARKVLDEMEAAACCFPDVKTWTILIQGALFGRKIDAALTCLTDMIAKNYQVDGELLDVMLKGLCNATRVTDAHTLFLEMTGKGGVKPLQVTYKYMIEKLLENRKLEEAMRLLVKMKIQRLPPFADPFSPYISKYGTVDDAKEFLKALNSKDCPSPPAYLILFKSFFNEGRYSEAQDLLFKCPHHIRKHSDISKLFGSIQPGNHNRP